LSNITYYQNPRSRSLQLIIPSVHTTQQKEMTSSSLLNLLGKLLEHDTLSQLSPLHLEPYTLIYPTVYFRVTYFIG